MTPHGAFGFVRRTTADGKCGYRGIYPCTHAGVDLAGAKGTPVYAPERVTTSNFAFDNETDGLRGFGPGALRLKGASGALHILGHLDPAWWKETIWQVPGSVWEGFRGKPRLPKQGRVYKEGEQLGVISAPANHVHWQVMLGKRPVDPMRWVTGELGTELRTDVVDDGMVLALLAMLFAVGGRRRSAR